MQTLSVTYIKRRSQVSECTVTSNSHIRNADGFVSELLRPWLVALIDALYTPAVEFNSLQLMAKLVGNTPLSSGHTLYVRTGQLSDLV